MLWKCGSLHVCGPQSTVLGSLHAMACAVAAWGELGTRVVGLSLQRFGWQALHTSASAHAIVTQPYHHIITREGPHALAAADDCTANANAR